MCVHQEEEQGLWNTPGPALRPTLSTATGEPLYTLLTKGGIEGLSLAGRRGTEKYQNASIDLRDKELLSEKVEEEEEKEDEER